MKKAFTACSEAVLACVAVNDDGSTRKRCELFRELPNKRVSVIGRSVLVIVPLLTFDKYL
jgi:hypothetical protein